MDEQLLNAAQLSVRRLLRQEVPAIIDLHGLEDHADDLRPLLQAVAKRARADRTNFGALPQPEPRPTEIPPIPADSLSPVQEDGFSHLLESVIHGIQSYIPQGVAQLRLAPVAPLIAVAILLAGGGVGFAAKGGAIGSAVLGAFSQPAGWVDSLVNDTDPTVLPPIASTSPPLSLVLNPPEPPADPPASLVSAPPSDPPEPPSDPPGQDIDPPGPPIDPPGLGVNPPEPPINPPGQGNNPPGPPINPPGQGNNPPGPPINPPGQGDNPPGPPIDPPGQGDDPPGPPIDPPGQGDDPPGPPSDPPGQGDDDDGGNSDADPEDVSLLGGFEVVALGPTYDFVEQTTSFTYTVTNIEAQHDLGHWVLGSCLDPVQVIDVDNTTPGFEDKRASADPTTGLRGIKWEGEGETFTLTVEGIFEVGTVDFALKTGQDVFTGQIAGISCNPSETAQTLAAAPAGATPTMAPRRHASK